ncbi:MAG: hypothetical protein U0169_22670 [Polyangiaceae bacterium]
MGSCTLEIGTRVVLRSEGGAPEAEYALFDAGCIELSALEPGTIREAAYRTTVAEAKDRLESAGVTLDLAYEATEVMRPKLAALYARGDMARRAAHLLGPAELFEGHVFDGASRRYRGHWLDIASLAADVKMLRATTAFQILHLLAILHEHDDDDPVSLLTADYTRERRPGERTLRRVLLDHTAALPDALRALDAAPKPLPTERDQGAPSRVELLDGVRTRLREGSPATFRAHVDSLERVLNVRERPDKGPLADPELWALEEQLSVGDARGVIPKVEVIERTSGRGPATTYLRARAALIAGVVDPRSIAERVAPLAESMSTFVELELLAAEAWAAAGELRRAVPYARDLASMPSLDDVLRTRAREVLARAEAAGIHTQGSSPPSAGAARSPSSPPASARGVIPESGPPGARREVVIRESSPASPGGFRGCRVVRRSEPRLQDRRHRHRRRRTRSARARSGGVVHRHFARAGTVASVDRAEPDHLGEPGPARGLRGRHAHGDLHAGRRLRQRRPDGQSAGRDGDPRRGARVDAASEHAGRHPEAPTAPYDGRRIEEPRATCAEPCAPRVRRLR